MRIIVIGAGSIGRRHHDNLTALGARSELVPFRSYEPKVLAGADAVVVATSTDVRLGPITDAADLGLPVYVEKPLAFRSADLAALTAVTAKIADRSMLGLMMRYHPAFRALAQTDLSDVVRFTFEIGHDVTQWRQNWRFSESYAARGEGGGVLLDLCHELDMAACLFGGLSLLGVDSLGHGTYPGVDMASRVSLLAPNGAVGEVAMDYLTPRLHRRATLRGTDRMHDFDFAAQSYLVTDHSGPRGLTLPLERNEMFLGIMRDFLALVAGKPTSDIEHLPRLDRVAESTALVASAWEARQFRGTITKDIP